MNLKDAIVLRIKKLCKEYTIAPNEMATHSEISPSTIYSIFSIKSKSPEVATIKKICNGLEITFAQFFDADAFNNLEQEIK